MEVLEYPVWLVEYKDGSYLAQYEDENHIHKVKEIQHDNVTMLRIFRVHEEKVLQCFAMKIHPDIQKVEIFHRVKEKISNKGRKRTRKVIFGVKHDTGEQTLWAVDKDGNVEPWVVK